MNQPVSDYTYLQNTTWRLKAQYPVLRVKTLGKSVVGRSIYGLEIGRESAPAVIMVGTVLGTDSQSGPLLLQLAEHLLQSLTDGQTLSGVAPVSMLCNRKIVLIPVLNPDGREICEKGAHCAGLDSGRIRRLSGGHTKNWDANAKGVDLTHNFDIYFEKRKERRKGQGIYGPCRKGYGGPYPESEPETAALADYCRRQTIRYTLSFYPGKGEIFWRNQCDLPDLGEQMARLLAVCSGYDVEASIGKITDTGFRNWAANLTEKPSLDVMLHPFPDQTGEQDLYFVLQEMLTAACLF